MSQLFWFGSGVQVDRLHKRCVEDEEMVRNRTRRRLEDLRYVDEVLSCLIKGVYARDDAQDDRGRANAEVYWRSLDYEPVLNLGVVDENDRRQVAVPGAPYARLMLFQRIGLGPNDGKGLLRVEDTIDGHGQHTTVEWPMYVVAIRGTIKTERDDLKADLKIVLETICHEVHLYQPIMRVVTAIYEKYGKDVCVAGHSLGATLGLIATRRLAIDQSIVLSGHFFNPPNVSLDVLAKKVVTGAMNGLAEGAQLIPLVGRATRHLIRGSSSTAVSVAEGVVRSVSKFVFSNKFDEAEGEHRTLLARGYCPHLYVNPKDFICNEFIAHFEGPDPPAVSNAVPFTQVLLDVQSSHLIPAAYLHTNHWATGPHEAHKLHQWFLYDHVNLTSKLAR